MEKTQDCNLEKSNMFLWNRSKKIYQEVKKIEGQSIELKQQKNQTVSVSGILRASSFQLKPKPQVKLLDKKEFLLELSDSLSRLPKNPHVYGKRNFPKTDFYTYIVNDKLFKIIND